MGMPALKAKYPWWALCGACWNSYLEAAIWGYARNAVPCRKHRGLGGSAFKGEYSGNTKTPMFTPDELIRMREETERQIWPHTRGPMRDPPGKSSLMERRFGIKRKGADAKN